MDLGAKTALITGGASGIGAEIARRLHALGAVVLIADVNDAAGAALASELGERARFCRLDITAEDQVSAVVDSAVKDVGRIDILVNNAGVTNDKLMLRMSREDWDKVITVNLTGSFLVTKAVSRHMLKQRSGRIINIASVIGLIGNVGQANYAASKAALIGLTKSCAKEFAGRNVTVNAVAPGFIRTRMTDALSEEAKQSYLKAIPLGRFGEPADVADLVAFLASDMAGYITGQVITIDGGMVMG